MNTGTPNLNPNPPQGPDLVEWLEQAGKEMRQQCLQEQQEIERREAKWAWLTKHFPRWSI